MNNLTFDSNGWDDYLYWQMQDRKTLKKNKQPDRRYKAEWCYERNRETRTSEIPLWIFQADR